MTAIRAIAMDYSGTTFVSTLEADWALTLDRWNIGWQYEPEGVRLPSGVNYRPDLYLPRVSTWLEVKGPHDERIGKAHGLAVACLHAPGCSSGDPAQSTTVNPQAVCACGFGPHFPWRLTVIGRASSSGVCIYHGADHPRWPDPQIVLARCPTCQQLSFADATAGVRICRRCHALDPKGFRAGQDWAPDVYPSGSLTFSRNQPPRGRRRTAGKKTRR